MAKPKVERSYVGNKGVHVTGIPELNRALRALDREAYLQLRKEFRALTREVIGVAEGLGAPTGILKPTITQKGAGIVFPGGGPGSGKGEYEFYPWLDFGGGRELGRGVTSSTGTSHRRSPTGRFRRAVIRGGRFLYPAIAESREAIADAAYEAIGKAARSKGFETRGL